MKLLKHVRLFVKSIWTVSYTHLDVYKRQPLERSLPPLPENFEFDDIGNRPPFIQYLCCAHRRLRHASHWTPLDYQYYLYAYYHYLSTVDRQIGEILSALEAGKNAGNTAVIFFSDHGEGMAAHRMVTKYGVFYEESNRVPFLVSGPGIPAGKRITGVASLLDLLPTMLDVYKRQQSIIAC